jgi:hypothetical protein
VKCDEERGEEEEAGRGAEALQGREDEQDEEPLPYAHHVTHPPGN